VENESEISTAFSTQIAPEITPSPRTLSLLSLRPGYSLTQTVEHLASLAGTKVSQDYQGSSLDAVRQMAMIGAGVAILPSLYALAEAIRQPDFVVRRLDHPEAVHRISLHWRSTSPMADAFETLSQALVAVKEEIRAARTDPFARPAT
jgi:LysR family transcriptional regulator, hydrogen peroxide-inducible genes activator